MDYINKETGWSLQWTRKVSENYNTRPLNTNVSLLVIHCISLPRGIYNTKNVEHFFQNKLDIQKYPQLKSLLDTKVSSHFLIERTGHIIQFVSIYNRAWHAGESKFNSIPNCNDYSIGIELEGTDDDIFEEKQYESLIILTKVLKKIFPEISNDRIVAHSDISPGRKTDPGIGFDWKYFMARL